MPGRGYSHRVTADTVEPYSTQDGAVEPPGAKSVGCVVQGSWLKWGSTVSRPGLSLKVYTKYLLQ